MPPAHRSDSTVPRYRLAIVGGGIAGLTLAVTLGRYEERGSPIQIDLYEAGPEITTVGAGISVWPRTWEVMRYLGLYDELVEAAVKSHGTGNDDQLKPAFFYRKSDWSREGYEFSRIIMPNGSRTMHRAEMMDVLVRNLPKHCSIHTSKRLVNYSESTSPEGGEPLPQTSYYTLHFADGTTAEADVVIGADGIKSKTRAAMYRHAHARDCANPSVTSLEGCERCRHATPKWSGSVGYRYLIPSEKLRDINPGHRVLESPALISYSGKSKHIITYPISRGKYVNFIGFVSKPEAEGTAYPRKWVTDATREELVNEFSGWEPEVEQLLQSTANPTVWAIHMMDNLPFWVSGRVALMGDAVHAMTTHFGAGGGQAIEDAYILGRLLADPRTSLQHVAGVFAIYQAVRLPFARGVVQNSDKLGKLCEFDWPGLYDGSFPTEDDDEVSLAQIRARLDELGSAIVGMWEWQTKEKVEKQWLDAEGRYVTMLAEMGEQAKPEEARAASTMQSKLCTVT